MMSPKHKEVRTILKFSEGHEWTSLDGEICSVGFSSQAVEQVDDIVFVEFPEISKIMDKGDVAAVIEWVKPASVIYSPAAGQTTEIYNALLDDLTSFTPEGAIGNWLFKLKITDVTVLNHLMDEDVYKELVG